MTGYQVANLWCLAPMRISSCKVWKIKYLRHKTVSWMKIRTCRNFRQVRREGNPQLERIREIRASERKFYQKITDLYASAMDYGKLLL